MTPDDKRNLDLCAQVIETQYDIARITLFRAFDRLERYQGIKAKEFGLEGPDVNNQISHRNLRCDLPGPDTRARLEPIDATLHAIAEVTGEGAKADAYSNVATYNGRKIERLSVRITIWWQNRQLTREYVLPDLASKKG